MRDLYRAVEDVAAAIVLELDVEPTDEDYGRAVSAAYAAVHNYRGHNHAPVPPADTNKLVQAALRVKARDARWRVAGMV